MNRKGIVEELYLGRFNPGQTGSFRLEEQNEKVETLLSNYRELIRKYPPALLEKGGRLPEDLLRKLGEIGIFGLNIPETYGGVGASLRQYLKVVEAMSRDDLALAIIPIAHLSIGIKGILLFGTEDQKKRYLPRAASGGMIFAYALTEPKFGSDAKHIETTATLSEDGSHYILNGTKTYITNGNYAGGLTVFAQLNPDKPGFMGAFIVETAWEGVQVGADMPKMGLSISSTTAIRFKNVKVPVQNLLGQEGDGFKIAMTVLNYGRLGLGAASAGVLKRSLEDMIQRAAGRKQFGRPIDSFDLIQEKIVKAKVRSLMISAMTSFTAHLLEQNPTESLAIESSHCKLFGTTRAWDTLYDALQVAGGAGYIATQPFEKRMRDFRVTTVFEGTTEIHSIYPPLFLVKSIGKRIKERHVGRIGMPYYLLKAALQRVRLSLPFHNPVMKKAVRLIRKNAQTIRRMIFFGLLVHGKKMMEKEFLLRRITRLSLDTYGIFATVTFLNEKSRTGEKIEEESWLLSYFLEEAYESRKKNRRFFTDEKEKLHRRIFRNLR